jgi:hypothetical protein
MEKIESFRQLEAWQEAPRLELIALTPQSETVGRLLNRLARSTERYQ